MKQIDRESNSRILLFAKEDIKALFQEVFS